MRTTVKSIGQVETDEIYVGVDRQGAHYVLPVQAKGGRDKISVVQIEQDLAMCGEKFPQLICRAIGAQFMDGDVIALLEFCISEGQIAVAQERHYELVSSEDISPADLRQYGQNSAGPA